MPKTYTLSHTLTLLSHIYSHLSLTLTEFPSSLSPSTSSCPTYSLVPPSLLPLRRHSESSHQLLRRGDGTPNRVQRTNRTVVLTQIHSTFFLLSPITCYSTTPHTPASAHPFQALRELLTAALSSFPDHHLLQNKLSSCDFTFSLQKHAANTARRDCHQAGKWRG
jgi:hypothetical protein